LRSRQIPGCNPPIQAYVSIRKEVRMKKKTERTVEQLKPFTPGITQAKVRQHAYEMFRDKLPQRPLTLADWVLAEKDLVASLDADNLPK
jgi:hypothetical protein